MSYSIDYIRVSCFAFDVEEHSPNTTGVSSSVWDKGQLVNGSWNTYLVSHSRPFFWGECHHHRLAKEREREPEIEICCTHPVIFDGYKLLRLPLRSNMKTPQWKFKELEGLG